MPDEQRPAPAPLNVYSAAEAENATVLITSGIVPVFTRAKVSVKGPEPSVVVNGNVTPLGTTRTVVVVVETTTGGGGTVLPEADAVEA